MASIQSPRRLHQGRTCGAFLPEPRYMRCSFPPSSSDPVNFKQTGTYNNFNVNKALVTGGLDLQASASTSASRPSKAASNSRRQSEKLPPIILASSSPPWPPAPFPQDSEAFSFPSLLPPLKLSTSPSGISDLPVAYSVFETSPSVHRYLKSLRRTVLASALEECQQVSNSAGLDKQVPLPPLRGVIERFKAHESSYMLTKLTALYSDEAIERRRRRKKVQKQLFRSKLESCVVASHVARPRGAQAPSEKACVGRGMEKAYEQALVRLKASDSPYLREKIASLFMEKKAERRRKKRNERDCPGIWEDEEIHCASTDVRNSSYSPGFDVAGEHSQANVLACSWDLLVLLKNEGEKPAEAVEKDSNHGMRRCNKSVSGLVKSAGLCAAGVNDGSVLSGCRIKDSGNAIKGPVGESGIRQKSRVRDPGVFKCAFPALEGKDAEYLRLRMASLGAMKENDGRPKRLVDSHQVHCSVKLRREALGRVQKNLSTSFKRGLGQRKRANAVKVAREPSTFAASFRAYCPSDAAYVRERLGIGSSSSEHKQQL